MNRWANRKVLRTLDSDVRDTLRTMSRIDYFRAATGILTLARNLMSEALSDGQLQVVNRCIAYLHDRLAEPVDLPLRGIALPDQTHDARLWSTGEYAIDSWAPFLKMLSKDLKRGREFSSAELITDLVLEFLVAPAYAPVRMESGGFIFPMDRPVDLNPAQLRAAERMLDICRLAQSGAGIDDVLASAST